MRQILLFSAGLDSFPAWHYLGRPPALYFDIRHHFREQELAAVNDLAGRCQMDLTISTELDLSFGSPMSLAVAWKANKLRHAQTPTRLKNRIDHPAHYWETSEAQHMLITPRRDAALTLPLFL